MLAVRDTATTPSLRGQFPTRPAEVTPASRRERVVFALACATLVLPVWMEGAWEAWAQKITLALAVLMFAVLFVPMFDYRGWPPSPSAQIIWSRLKKFPIFWIGLAILVYGVVAALNPSRAVFVVEEHSGLESMPHISFLPHSILSPFLPMNAWHALMVVAPAFLAVCAAWAGLSTELCWRRLLGVMAANGAAIAVVGMLQARSGTRKMFWLFDPQPGNVMSEFFGSFVYPGHAAAWMVLGFGAAAAMMDHGLRRRDPLAPPRRWGWPAITAWLWLGVMAAILVALGLFVKPDFWSLAAGGVLLICVWLWLARLWRAGQKRRAALYALPALVFMTLMLLATGAAVWWWQQGGAAKALEVNLQDPALPLRYEFAYTSVAMIKDEPWFGWGPGSFHYVSPYYLSRNPMFHDSAHPTEVRYGLQYALSDWVQIPAEWGVLGAGLFAAAALWWVGKSWRMRQVLPGDSWIALGAVAMVFVGAAADCPFYNPAVLIAAALLPAAAIKLGEFSSRLRPALSNVVVACP